MTKDELLEFEVDDIWGDDDSPTSKQKTKKVIEKIKKPREIKEKQSSQKKPKRTLEDKIKEVKEQVYTILGKQVDNVITIRDLDSFHKYIDKCINNNIIAIDTETNNSLDPITCKLMGPCIYTYGEKQVYIPINHIDMETRELLPNQLTEEDVKNEFQRLIDNNVKIIMHNGKFDYQVIKCTCGLELPIDWDTLIGARLLNENEPAGLKEQYISKIDPEQEKYSIENLFEKLEYAIFDPELFALYAATDALMTLKLYDYQMSQFRKIENIKLYNLAKELEMPLVIPIAEMELAGMEIDQDYAVLLGYKYHKILDNIDKKIANELEQLKPKIDAWRLTEDAQYHPEVKNGDSRGEAAWPDGKPRYGKSKSEQLEENINLASPTQLAIMIYDVLKCPSVDKKSPRGTGEAILDTLAEKTKLPLFQLLMERRKTLKLLTTYIDNIPELAKQWPDGRVRTHFNQYGADTGRLSSSKPLNF